MHGLLLAQELGPLWLGSRSLNPNFLQLGLTLPSSLTCQLCGLSAIWTRPGPRPGGVQSPGLPGSTHQWPSWQMPRVSATPASLTAPRCPRWGSQPGISPPGRAGLPTAPYRSPAWGFSPLHRVGRETCAPPTKLRGISHHPGWGGQSGVPPPGCGVPTSLVEAQSRVPLFSYGVPQVRKWERSLGSLFTVVGGGVSTGLSGSPEWGPSFGLRVPQWGNSSTLRGSYSSGWEQRMGSCLHVDGFLRRWVGSQSEAPAPGCGVPIVQGGNPDWDPLHPVRSWCRRQSARCSRRPNSPPPRRGASSSLQGSERAASGKARGPAVQRGKPQLAQGPPRYPFQTRDAGEPRGTRAPPDRAQHTAGRFVRSCHPKPVATPRRDRGGASPYLRALARRRALPWAAPGCTGRPDPHCQLQQLGRRRFRPYHAVTRSGRSPQA